MTTKTENDELTEQAQADAVLLCAMIADNDRYNSVGLPEDDLRVCFEMDDACDWGLTYTPARFKRALKALAEVGTAQRVGERWFSGESAKKALRRESRVCAGPRCETDITHLRSGALYCSSRCQVAAGRKTRRQAV